MKKLMYLFFSFVLLLLMQSCKKNQDHVSKQYTIDTTLSSGMEYQLNLQPYGDADDVASISKQATNYTTSGITNTAGTFAPVYHYSVITKESLSDQVILAIKEGDRGNGSHPHNSDSTIITINFTIK